MNLINRWQAKRKGREEPENISSGCASCGGWLGRQIMSVFELFISAIFVNNIVLAQYLGNCPYLGCSRDKGVAVGMGSAVIFVIFMATLCTWLMQRYVLVPSSLATCRPSCSSS